MLAFYLSTLDDSGDKALFAQIYERYEWKMYAVALNILKEPRAAEDAVHDALVKIISHFETAKKYFYDSCLDLEPWIVIIVKRTALDALKKGKYSGPFPEDWEPAGDDPTQALDGFDALVGLIRSMPEGYRAVLELRLVAEWSFQEIGKELGISASAAQVRYSRGLKLLQEKLRKEGYDYAGEGV